MASTISRGIKTQQGNPKRCQRVCSFVVSANTHTHTHKSSKAGMRSGFGSCMCIRAFIAKWLLPCLKLCTILGRQSCRHSRRMQNAALTKDVQRQRSSLEPKPAERRAGWRKSSNSVSVLRGVRKRNTTRGHLTFYTCSQVWPTATARMDDPTVVHRYLHKTQSTKYLCLAM